MFFFFFLNIICKSPKQYSVKHETVSVLLGPIVHALVISRLLGKNMNIKLKNDGRQRRVSSAVPCRPRTVDGTKFSVDVFFSLPSLFAIYIHTYIRYGTAAASTW